MIEYKLHHIGGLYFEILSDEGKNREYDVSFVDRTTKDVVFETKLKNNCYAQLTRRYFSDIAIFVRYEGRTIKQINIIDEVKGKNVFISFESASLGDTIAWIPYCRLFAETYQCKMHVSTFHNYLFERRYPDLVWIPKNSMYHNIHFAFDIGWHYDKDKEPVHPATIPLQKAASNILNLLFSEIIPVIDFSVSERPYQGKYFAISTISTSQLKHWYYWQELIDKLNEMGYQVVEVSKEDTTLQNVIKPEDKSLDKVMNILHHAEGYIGLSSGISWLNWALGKRGFMISNFTTKDHEFQTNCIRITNPNVCHGCWHNPLFRFNKGQFDYCPEHEDTDRHFECHKEISMEMVLEEIKKAGY